MPCNEDNVKTLFSTTVLEPDREVFIYNLRALLDLHVSLTKLLLILVVLFLRLLVLPPPPPPSPPMRIFSWCPGGYQKLGGSTLSREAACASMDRCTCEWKNA